MQLKVHVDTGASFGHLHVVWLGTAAALVTSSKLHYAPTPY